MKLEFSPCHRLPHRSFFWKGKQFPVCARCTGIHVGYISMFLFVFNLIAINFWFSLLLMVPTYLDGFVQALSDYESKNWRRFITGIFSGIGTMSIVSIVGKWIGFQILNLF